MCIETKHYRSVSHYYCRFCGALFICMVNMRELTRTLDLECGELKNSFGCVNIHSKITSILLTGLHFNHMSFVTTQIDYLKVFPSTKIW